VVVFLTVKEKQLYFSGL